MSSVRLSPLDSAWLFTESRATPNHVGGLLQFRLPDKAPNDFLGQLMRDFRNHREFTPPWNRRLKYAFNKNPVPVWVEDQNIDLEYHVRHSALPWPGGERELGELVGRLQSQPLDLSRPPWECTLIEGLEGGRFAMFIKIHHSLVDGVGGMKLLQRAMSTDQKSSLKIVPFWAAPLPTKAASNRKAQETSSSPTMAEAAAAGMEALRGQVKSVPQLVAAFGKMLKGSADSGEGMIVPFSAPRSVLNGRVREKRRFATQQFSMERIRSLASAAGCTINDIVLAVCGAALRKFLLERGNLPEQSLTTGIPVSVRPLDDESGGNAISFIIATLGTDLESPLERLEAIRNSVRHAKDHVQSLPKQAMLQYTMLLMAPTLLSLLTGMGGRTRPMFNITISNVPGPDKPLYFRGAELLATYPASIITHGQALNITCQSYAGYLNFGFTACHTSMPSMQKLAVYSAQAMNELEAAIAKRGVSKTPLKRSAKKTTTKPPPKPVKVAASPIKKPKSIQAGVVSPENRAARKSTAKVVAKSAKKSVRKAA
jgi:diacylglycerol O-acyltransferase / wax synthase